MKQLGKHIILELWGCEKQALDDQPGVEKMLVNAVKACGATLICVKTHKFSPQGVTGVAVLAESHISIHTWPELGYAAMDVFTCGEHVIPEDTIPEIRNFLKPDKVEVIDIKRGIVDIEEVLA
ncbi:S-adenosylmethionine decarboxylase related [Methanococcus vannielii SB]|uniref:S-adenosylmethionine decarboxylase proenzyme n=1 Tax=Methanococcus vannielii (strain ATCC 35089 / DSM 1224 / JCM 13029 / OCM 148 / SB) TaxID=406327 RepID=SPEH_METVS|nr:adenosylmethionine decarboxylase [Methanococcus vannielii]A6UQM8.1 RecName: Full=S-adenosylmethionine decarboxylase proenzyme; Short=AdoMetDC; Short=SAMDC; Contains: RecName: Full=S-adenosylmethionine decarboxylase beta chain; Contains: RecName: Full=S-adenosylmethionine decarboxylase alpha chain; Flags: Precursor [Methanococcus vannielii SB]ABR54800.1 S-adenosylmethionine decarboxylase related [Methanococcus vannielii SB]